MIVMQSVRLALIGVVVGVFGALATTRLLQSLLFEVQPTDPATLVAVSIGLVILAAAASWVPARRAMAVDPVEALRNGGGIRAAQGSHERVPAEFEAPGAEIALWADP